MTMYDIFQYAFLALSICNGIAIAVYWYNIVALSFATFARMLSFPVKTLDYASQVSLKKILQWEFCIVQRPLAMFYRL